MATLEKNICPDGTWCVSYTTGFAIVIIIVLSCYILAMHLTKQPMQSTLSPSTSTSMTLTSTAPTPSTSPANNNNYNTPLPHDSPDPNDSHTPQVIDKKWEIPVSFHNDVSNIQIPPSVTNVYTAPTQEVNMLRPPLRQAPDTTTTNIGLMPINIPTRGETPDIQQVGVLRSKTNDKVLALYGRPTYRGSSKWIYYTGTDKYHSIKLPVEKNNRDCTAEYGCDELYEDDEVQVKGSGEVYQTSIYQLDAPRYIPFVVG